MERHPDILCIGSVLWDMVGRAERSVPKGSDLPGRIRRLPGGVALNVAMTLVRFGMRPAILSAVGRDAQGDALLGECTIMGIETGFVWRHPSLPTDRYMAIEDADGLVAAIADAHTLEDAGAHILDALEDGRLGSPTAPYAGLIALDGNLTGDLLADIAGRDSFRAADLRLAPASPGKADRLAPLMHHPGATLYVNIEEAGTLAGRLLPSAAEAARALLDAGAHRVLVTNGGGETAEGAAGAVHTAKPPGVRVQRVTGAGDTFMAAHIAAEARGDAQALESALKVTAEYVSGKDG